MLKNISGKLFKTATLVCIQKKWITVFYKEFLTYIDYGLGPSLKTEGAYGESPNHNTPPHILTLFPENAAIYWPSACKSECKCLIWVKHTHFYLQLRSGIWLVNVFACIVILFDHLNCESLPAPLRMSGTFITIRKSIQSNEVNSLTGTIVCPHALPELFWEHLRSLIWIPM